MRKALVHLFALALVLSLAGCGESVAEKRVAAARARAQEAIRRPASGPKQITIVAQGIAWDRTYVVVPVGREVRLTMDHRDVGIQHNIRVDYGAGFATPVENGPVQQVLELRIPDPGRYRFICDVHPNMVGTIQAA